MLSMDSPVSSLQRMKLRAFDVSERTAKLSRKSLSQRVDRWRSRLFFIIQCAITAGLAWWLAHHLLRHPMPFFAPVASIICLGFTFGNRLRRGIEVSLGVALGIFIGDLFVTYFGSGPWQIAVVIVIAMSAATLLGAGQLLIIQSGVQSAIIIGLSATPNQGLNRWLDAVVGCAIALVAATIVPLAPLRKPRVLAASVLTQMADTLAAAEAALRADDSAVAEQLLEQVREADKNLADLDEAAAEGMAVVRYSPFRRRHLPAVQAYSELHEPLDRAHRNLRVLVRRTAVAIWRQEEVPAGYLQLMASLAEVMRFMSQQLSERHLPTAARDQLIQLAVTSSHARLLDSMSGVVILAQLRSMITDLLQLTGLDYAEARAAVPDMD
jgi:uncharacterized membrane protein YgaE (UPF0421/DUF939 family)